MSVLLPLLGNVAVHVARPFFPQDVADALAEAKAPRLLVTTPVHLRALVEAGVSLPPMAGIVTATAPRSEEHTSELQSLMRSSYAVFCLKKKNNNNNQVHN